MADVGTDAIAAGGTSRSEGPADEVAERSEAGRSDLGAPDADSHRASVVELLTAWGPRVLLVLSVLAVTVPIIASAAIALRDGWIPTADVALMALRADDVFGGEVPLVGIHSRGSQFGSDTPVYHPGPLPFWVLAPFVVLTGSTVTGLVLGTVAVNLASVLAVLWVVKRRGGSALLPAVAIGMALMMWALRGEVLRDPWTPHLALLPFTLVLLVAWFVSTGDHRLLPLLVVSASFVVQSHVTYLPLVAGLCGLALVGLAVLAVREVPVGVDEGGPGLALRRPDVLRSSMLAAGVGLLCWIGPLIDQVRGEGNLVALFEVAQADDVEKLGLVEGVGRVVGSLGAVPIWLSQSDDISRVIRPSGPLDLVVAVLSLAAAAATAAFAWRRRDRFTVSMITTAFVGIAFGIVLVARAPRYTQAIEFYWYRWMWPIGMFLWLAIIWGTLRHIVRGPVSEKARAGAYVAGAAVLVVLVAVGVAQPPLSGDRDGVRYRQLTALYDQAGEVLQGTGPYLLDMDGTMFWHTSTMAAGLESAGVRVVVEPDDLPWGERRIYRDDTAVAGRLFVTGGPNGRQGPPGARLVAFVPIRAESEEDVSAHIRTQLQQHPVTLRADARRLLQRLIDGEDPEVVRASEDGDRWPEELTSMYAAIVQAQQQHQPSSASAPIQLDPALMSDRAVLVLLRWHFITEDSLDAATWHVTLDQLVEDGYARTDDSGMAIFLLPPP